MSLPGIPTVSSSPGNDPLSSVSYIFEGIHLFALRSIQRLLHSVRGMDNIKQTTVGLRKLDREKIRGLPLHLEVSVEGNKKQ